MKNISLNMREEFIESIKNHQTAFGLNLSEEKINALANYYAIILEHNTILHLVAPSSGEEFATRHILESLTLLEFLPKKVKFADVGTGAGLPSIPCLIVREDLRGVLIESKLKKVKFLEEVVEKCRLQMRPEIINRQFEEIRKPDVSFVLCRALDKFTQKLPRLLKWSERASLLFFGGNSLRQELQTNRVKFKEKLMPMSEQRFLFIAQK
ncbi:MAG TPA: 16S rRNA (guanine(527)-N(7))-methyltransferase RsmG [Pyrinomonadaceae bacterium]|nr:16S rRNA (guanine(527)-N(7))-methyltransferase RsmG [Pyrinomonadaceae bacterium]